VNENILELAINAMKAVKWNVLLAHVICTPHGKNAIFSLTLWCHFIAFVLRAYWDKGRGRETDK